MTLTLDEVRQTRFHLARRNGYEPADVDTFVDKVEVTISQLYEENETLKKQVDALRNSEQEPIFAPPQEGADTGGLQAELDAAKQAAEEANQRVAELAARNEELEEQVSRLQEEAQVAPIETPAVVPAAAATEAASVIAERIVVTTSAEASPAVVRLVQLATEQAEQVVGEAQSEATRKVEEANKKASETLADARVRADRMESEARVNAEQIRGDARAAADQLTGEAQDRAGKLDGETAQKRTELFAALENERDDLLGRVDHLRSFESTFRENLTGLLQNHLTSLTDTKGEPDDVPSLVTDPRPRSQSATPRLDALLDSQGNQE
ncbi:DivIVA domain-containing protein [Propionicicella superfundia]|uniref:DivIVA domain-containing protein n=1 Tax=Propionicicella superfundia TaxID=348582 RepID=UPI00041337C5|nr:DivIVA domain-containing protein [Propionicicella superfundia]